MCEKCRWALNAFQKGKSGGVSVEQDKKAGGVDESGVEGRTVTVEKERPKGGKKRNAGPVGWRQAWGAKRQIRAPDNPKRAQGG